MSTKTAIRVAIADGNQLFRECLVEFLSLKGYLVVQKCSKKNDLLLQNSDPVPDVCLVHLKADEVGTGAFIKDLKNSNPSIKVILYSLEVYLKEFRIPLFGADAMLAETTSLVRLERELRRVAKRNVTADIR